MSKFTCCVPECKSNSRKNEHLTFHRFPADPDLRFQWLIKIRKKEFKISANTRVCSEHFMTDDYKEGIDNNGRKSLKWKAVPSQFAWHKNTERRKLVRRNPKNRVDSLGTGSAPEQKRKIEDSTENQLRVAQAEIEVLKTELEAMKIYKFGVERFGNDDEAIRFYTGFPTRLHFSTFFEFVQPSAETMNYCYASGISSNRFASRKMLLIDELFMFLVRVRVGLLQQDLAYRFNIHESTVSRKIVTWANYLYFFLGSQPIWPTLSVVQHHSLPGFKELYPSTKVIIDCTEIKVQVPTSLLLQSQT